ncbi:MAG: efflux RND transporter periplasmic adaptor subunit [Steroidobacteraceae bacterium]|nr:efflux RND transporter periplasmic adaptor subunit [Steroidobacteraceae bacterium]
MTPADRAASACPAPNPPARLLTLAILAAGLLVLAGCGQANGKPKAAAAEDSAPSIPVEVSQPRRGEMAAVYTGTAPLEAERKAFINPKVRGEIRAVLVEEGDRVREGQVLARLDGDQLRLELAQAEAQMHRLERDYARNLELQKKGLVSTTAFENLKYDLDAARATWELAKLQLSYTEIRAPISGTVTQKTDIVKVGNTVVPSGGVIQNADSALFAIEDLDTLHVRISVPERELRRLSAGQAAELAFDAVPGQRFAGEVTLIRPAVDAATATFQARVRVQDPQGLLKPGMFGRVAIVYERKADALQIPRAALLDGDGPPRVFVVSDGKAVEREVRLGLGNGAWVEVISGIADDDEVVVVGQGALRPGTEVRIVRTSATAAARARAQAAG